MTPTTSSPSLSSLSSLRKAFRKAEERTGRLLEASWEALERGEEGKFKSLQRQATVARTRARKLWSLYVASGG